MNGSISELLGFHTFTLLRFKISCKKIQCSRDSLKELKKKEIAILRVCVCVSGMCVPLWACENANFARGRMRKAF